MVPTVIIAGAVARAQMLFRIWVNDGRPVVAAEAEKTAAERAKCEKLPLCR